MRHIMLFATELVETRLKSLIAYYHAEKYGPLGYLDINNFNCLNSNKVDMTVVNNYLQITRKATQQQNLNYDSELFIKHHKDNKNGKLPFWVYIELLTISDVSKLYTVLDKDIQQNIAIQLGFKFNNANEIIQNLLHCTSILRNICAHGGRLYNRLFIRKPRLSSKDKKLLRIESRQIVFDKLFSYILVLKSLIQPNDFDTIKDQLIELCNKYNLANFKYYGFPDDWKKIL
jgi:abortive infection bacteriophage resistance protein